MKIPRSGRNTLVWTYDCFIFQLRLLPTSTSRFVIVVKSNNVAICHFILQLTNKKELYVINTKCFQELVLPTPFRTYILFKSNNSLFPCDYWEIDSRNRKNRRLTFTNNISRNSARNLITNCCIFICKFFIILH